MDYMVIYNDSGEDRASMVELSAPNFETALLTFPHHGRCLFQRCNY